MNKIKILDESISNIIAAGEVVENPASMVKELIENSLDAKAKSIRVEVKNSGRNVRISDTGTGMEKQDLFLCVERHATSKIKDKDDIFNLTSYGFRGEALASIGSISKLSISTKTKDSLTGHKINLNAGKITRYDEVSRNNGTEIEIKDLFFNTPARLKFLRKKSTEYARLREIVLKEALYNTDVSFTLVLDEREVVKTSGKGIQNTILELFGRNTLKNTTEFSLGYWGNLELLKSNKESIYTYVNGRYVKSKTIEKAVLDAYYTKLGKGKYPFAIIFFDILPQKVDVNVHPSKKIVKFTDEDSVYEEINSALLEAIYSDDRNNSINLIPVKQEEEAQLEVNQEKNNETKVTRVKEGSSQITKGSLNQIDEDRIKEEKELKDENNGSFIDFSALEGMIESNFISPSKEEKVKNEVIKTEQSSFEVKVEKTEDLRNKVEERIKKAKKHSENYAVFNPEIKELEKKVETKKIENVEMKINEPLQEKSEETLVKEEEIRYEGIKDKVLVDKNQQKDYKVIGQLRNMYILVETNNELEIYDQHIVHERILYEKLKSEHYEKKISAQTLLIPKKIELNPYEMESIKGNIEVLSEFGFEIEEFGHNEILIRSIPIFDFRESVEETFKSLLEDVKGKDPREKVIISMSCRNAIKAGQTLDLEEMNLLLKELHDIGKYSCPHGRPIILKMPFDEMDKKFQRK